MKMHAYISQNERPSLTGRSMCKIKLTKDLNLHNHENVIALLEYKQGLNTLILECGYTT